jgi:hypothetical protein
MSTCCGPSCLNTDLIEAHIIPRSFAAFIRGDDPSVPNVQLTLHSSKEAYPLFGEFDRDILCGSCDAVLGKLDEYAIGVARAFQDTATRRGNFFELPDIDGDKLARFYLAVIWRAGISSRRTFAEVDLGPHKDIVRDAIFSDAPMVSNTVLQVALERFVSEHVDVRKMFSVPRPSKLGGFRGYGFMIAGFRAFVKVDKRPLPGEQCNGVLKGKGPLRLYARRFEGTSEFDATADMMVAAHFRKTRQ